MFYTKQISKLVLWVMALWAIATSTTLADDYFYVNAAHLNVRSAWSVKWKIVAVVDSGYKMTVLEYLDSGWRKVLLENGQEGYVNGKFLTQAEPYYEKVTSSRYTIASGNAFLRWFDTRSIVAVLKNWDQLEVTSEKVYLNRWIQVRVATSSIKRYEWRTWYIAKRLLAPIEGYEYSSEVSYDNQDMWTSDYSYDAPVEQTVTPEVTTEDVSDISSEDILSELNSAPDTSVSTEESTSTEASGSSDVDSELADLLKWL